ncbi:glycosyltransferase family 4 protein [Singulisphaera sp. PoT]|uniref:glycosyltransferase family 4 protein n=1 Tax=Singulisphaera sp. PoT TaxID=3411797 RepID=UPI003BF476AC
MPELRKVAYLTPLYFDEKSRLGGGERFPLNLATGVAAAAEGRCTVELISFGERAARYSLKPGVSLRVLPVSNRPHDILNAVSWDLPAALADADLVHIHVPYTRSSELGILIAKQDHKPICVTDHGGASSTIGLNLGCLDLADRIVAYSDFGAALHRSTTPIETIKGGVDASTFCLPDTRPERGHVLFVGRLLPHKGIDYLIESLPPGVPLKVVGRPFREDYTWRINHLAVGKPVEFITDADDATLRELYQSAWVTVLPSVYHDCFGASHVAPELMGFALLESMACGTPAIGSRVGGMPEFIRDGETGYIYDSLDQLTDRILTLVESPDLVETMGQRGRQAVEAEFDLKVAGRKLYDLYRSLFEQAREAAA